MPVINNSEALTLHADGYCWAFKNMWVARRGKWKLLGNPVDTSNKGVLTETDSLFLVNLETDPGEMKNLSTVYPDLVEELKKQYEQWEKKNKHN